MHKNIYICGLPRGGTTLASMIFGAHPDAYLMGETMYLAKVDPSTRECSCGTVNCARCAEVYDMVKDLPSAKAAYEAYGALDALREPGKVPGRDTIVHGAPSSDLELQQMLDEGARGIDQIADAYRAFYGDKCYIDNTKLPEYAERLPKSSWQTVVVTRDLRGVAHSIKKAAARKNVPRTVESKIAQWRAFADLAIKMADSGVPVVRYEDICLLSDSLFSDLNAVAKSVGLTPIYDRALLGRPYEHHMLIGNHMAQGWNTRGITPEDRAWDGPNGLSQKEQTLITSNFADYFKRFEYAI